MLLCLDVIRPNLAWMLTRAHPYLAPMMADVRDAAGFATLDELAAAEPDSSRMDARPRWRRASRNRFAGSSTAGAAWSLAANNGMTSERGSTAKATTSGTRW